MQTLEYDHIRERNLQKKFDLIWDFAEEHIDLIIDLDLEKISD